MIDAVCLPRRVSMLSYCVFLGGLGARHEVVGVLLPNSAVSTINTNMDGNIRDVGAFTCRPNGLLMLSQRGILIIIVVVWLPFFCLYDG